MTFNPEFEAIRRYSSFGLNYSGGKGCIGFPGMSKDIYSEHDACRGGILMYFNPIQSSKLRVEHGNVCKADIIQGMHQSMCAIKLK